MSTPLARWYLLRRKRARLEKLNPPVGIPEVYRVNYLDDGGASAGLWYGANASPAWVYDKDSDSVYGIIQRYNYNGGSALKENTLFQYDMKKRAMKMIGVAMTDDGTIVGTADQHGVGTICFDHYGHMHIYGGGHNQAMKRSVKLKGSNVVTEQAAIAGSYTYSHPAHVGTTQWLFCRRASTGTYPGVYRKSNSIDPATGMISWSTEQTIVDLQTDTRVYFGTHQAVGTDIYIPWTRANAADEIRSDLYLGIFDTVNETLRNLDGSVVITKAQMPLTRAVADASFRLVDQGTQNAADPLSEQSNTPSMYVDNDVHFLYQGGPGGNTYFYARYAKTGARLEGPTNLGTAPYRYATPNIGPLPGGGVDVMFPVPDADILDMDTEAVFERGGSIHYRKRLGPNNWSAPEVIQKVTKVHPLDGVARVKNGPANFRYAFCERAIDDKDYGTGGNLRSFGWGSAGIVTTPFEEDPDAKNFIGSVKYSDRDRHRITSFFRGIKQVGWWLRGDKSFLLREPSKELAYKDVFGGAPLTEIGTGVTHKPYQGVDGDAASKLTSAFNPSTAPNKRLSLTSLNICVVPTENVQSATSDLGTTATTATLTLGTRGNTNNASTLLADGTALTQAMTRADVITMAQRTNNAKSLYWRRKLNIKADNNRAPTALPNGNLTLLGNSTAFSQRMLGYAHIGASIDVGPIMQVIKRYMLESEPAS